MTDVADHPPVLTTEPPSPRWTLAAPLHERVTLDYTSSPLSVFLKAAIRHQIDGSEPFVVEFIIDRATAAWSLLPDDAAIERTLADGSNFHLFASCGDDAHVRVTVQARDTVVHVSASSHDRAERLADAIRCRAPEPPTEHATPIRSWHLANHDRAVAVQRRIDTPRWSDIARN